MTTEAHPSHPRMPVPGPPGVTAPELTLRERMLVDAIAERLAGLLRETSARVGLVDAATVAAALNVTRDCVYVHAAELGGKRIGSGPRGRLRFDLDQALAAWTSRSQSKESHRPESPASASPSAGRKRKRKGSSGGLLPIKGSATPADARRERMQ
jgi:hypothetical protein